MGATTLPSPKSGRSRFSKALPAPPSFSNFLERKLNPQSQPPALPSLPPQLPPLSLGYSGASASTHSQSPRATPSTGKLLPVIDAGPPLPPPKELVREASVPASTAAAISRPAPLDSPLPPLPQKLEPKPESKPTMAMSIPRRRPVAAPAPVVSPVSEPEPASAPAPAPPPASVHVLPPPVLAPVPASVPVPVPSPLSATGLVPSPTPVSPIGLSPSPIGSFSSLLSAYSNHTSSSTPRTSTNSSNDVTSAKGSYSTVSPGEQTQGSGVSLAKGPGSTPSISDRNARDQKAHEQQTRPAEDQKAHEQRTRPTAEEQELPPPPPLKDLHRSPTPPAGLKLQTQAVHSPADTHSPSPLTNTSPKQDQLWRRRSLKSEKNLAVPQLKLLSSNGSTAAPNPNPNPPIAETKQIASNPQVLPSISTNQAEFPPAPAPAPAVAVARAPPPKTADAAFPGRNIRPAPSRQHIVSPIEQEEDMGHKHSRPAKDGSGSAPRKSPKSAQSSTVSSAKPLPSMPSPHPIVRLPTPEYETSDVKNPIVETIVSPVSPASSPDLPTEPKSAGIPKPATEAESQIRHARSSPALAARPAFVGAGRTPQGQLGPSAATRDRALDQPGQPPVSRREPTGPLASAFAKQREQVPQARPNEQRTVSESGSTASDETLKPTLPSFATATYQAHSAPPSGGPETEELDTTDNPGAALFPRNWYTPLPADTVMDARPLENKHFRCLTQHRYMTAARQRVNPIACRTCGTKDRNADAHICSACYLNICSKCNMKLRRVRGDLDQLLAQLEEKPAAVDARAQVAQETPRPDSDTFIIPSSQPRLSYSIEAE